MNYDKLLINTINTVALFFLLSSINLIYAQDIRVGAPTDSRWNPGGAYFDYSDPRYINISVNIWGYVRFPGKYFVPDNTRLIDLISYAGGPTPEAYLDDVRLFRNSEGDSSIQIFDFAELLYEKGNKIEIGKIPKLQAGDIVLLPGEPKLYFRDYTSLTLSITSTLISLAILIINLVRK